MRWPFVSRDDYALAVSEAEAVGGPMDGETFPMWRDVGRRFTYRSMRFGMVTYERDSATTMRHISTQSRPE